MRRALVVAGVLALALAPAGSAGQLGAQLYGANCISCHGPGGAGIADRGPSLRGVGARAADFYLRTGYMPLASPQTQPHRTRVRFSQLELAALVAYVASFGGGPPIPRPHPERGDLAQGQQEFTDHCAGCHQVDAKGGYVTNAIAPALDRAAPVEIAEAVRTGPYLMPRFSERQIGDAELDSIIRYVIYARHPDDRGGWALGHVGPVPEGLVAWFIGTALMVATCLVIGRRIHS
jgi:ubiquinol-cytochrome c reductase cytochrome c subunit